MENIEVWMNKLNGELALATPHWQAVTCRFDENLIKELDPMIAKEIGSRKIASGTLVQVGWLLQNQNDVWFGMPLSISEQFEVLGDA